MGLLCLGGPSLTADSQLSHQKEGSNKTLSSDAFLHVELLLFFSLSSWSHQKAVDFMAENTAMSLHNINTEIDRLIDSASFPGSLSRRPTDRSTD